MRYYILVERQTRKIDAIAESLSYFDRAVGYRFVAAEEADAACNPYDLYCVSFDRVYHHGVGVGHKLGHAIPSRKKQVPFGHAVWPEDEAGEGAIAASEPVAGGRA